MTISKHDASSESLPQICSYAYTDSTNNQVHTSAVFGTKVYICSTNFVEDTLIDLVGNTKWIGPWEDQRASGLRKNINIYINVYTWHKIKTDPHHKT